MQLGYADVGMIHYVDEKKDFDNIFNGEIIQCAKGLKEKGITMFIGILTHNPEIAFKAVETGIVDITQLNCLVNRVLILL